MAAACKFHPDAPSVAACSSCLSPLCDACLLFLRGDVYCRPCTTIVRGRRERSSAVFIAIAASAVVIAGIGALTFAHFYRPPFDYGELAPKVAAARQKL